MARGVPIHGQTTLPCKTGKLGKFGFRIVLVQGLNRQIRLMAAHFGFRVKQLLRVRIGNVKLGHLKPGPVAQPHRRRVAGAAAAAHGVVVRLARAAGEPMRRVIAADV